MPEISESVDKSLRLRVRIYIGIFVIALLNLVANVARMGTDAAVPVLIGLGVSLVFGLIASRMSRLSWNVTDGVVVGRIDALGVVILVGYILLIVFRGTLISRWFDPALVGVVGVSVLVGLMLGQVLGTVGGIVRVVRIAGSKSERGVSP